MLHKSLRPEFSFLLGIWLLFSATALVIFFLFGTITSPKTVQARQSRAMKRLHPRQPYCSSKNDVKGATREVPAADPQTQIPKQFNKFRTLHQQNLLQGTASL
jgi:hypothetical protein